MFRGRFLGLLLAVLLVAGILGLAGSSIYRAGWTQGYFMGKISDGGEARQTTVIPEPEAGRPPAYGWGYLPGGSFFGFIVKAFLVIFLIGMFFKFIGLLFWRKRGYPGWRGGWGPHHHEGWDSHWGRWGKHKPPWSDDEAEEPVMKA